MPRRLRPAPLLALLLAGACTEPGTEPESNLPPHIALPLLDLSVTPAAATGATTFVTVGLAQADSGRKRGLAVIEELWVDCNGNGSQDAGETAGGTETVRLECAHSWPDPAVPMTRAFAARARQSGGALVTRDFAARQDPGTVPTITGQVLSVLNDGTVPAGMLRINGVGMPFGGGVFSVQHAQISEGTHAARLTGNFRLQDQRLTVEDGARLTLYVIPAGFDLARLRAMLQPAGPDFDSRSTVRLPAGVTTLLIDDRYVHVKQGESYARATGPTAIGEAHAARVRRALEVVEPCLPGLELHAVQLSGGAVSAPDLGQLAAVTRLVYVGQLASQSAPVTVDVRHRQGEEYFAGIWLRGDTLPGQAAFTGALVRALGIDNTDVEDYTVAADGRPTAFGCDALKIVYGYPAGSGTRDVGLLSWWVNN